MTETKIDLNNFSEGALRERIEQEVQKVLENIADPNTDAKKSRKVTATLTFKANENRKMAEVIIDVKSTILQASPVATVMLIDHNSESVVGAELKSGIAGQTYFDGEQVRTDTGEPIEVTLEKTDKVIRFK